MVYLLGLGLDTTALGHALAFIPAMIAASQDPAYSLRES